MNFAKLFLLVVLSVLSTLIAPTVYGRQPTPGWTKTESAGVEYWMYRPTSLKDASGNSSLMLNLHGCIQTADVMKDLANWEPAAEKHKMTVVIPFVPKGGVVLGCWDFYGRDQTEFNKHNRPLIDLTLALMENPDLAIDRDRVFISGLSSGASQAMVLGCLRPDLYRGIGLAAGPVVGSEIGDVYRPKFSARDAAALCRSLAGTRSAEFEHQRFSIIFDQHDPTVNVAHPQMALEVMNELYGGNMSEVPIDLSRCEGANKRGSGTLYRDVLGTPRISFIQNTGLGHAWPSGVGARFPLWRQSTYVPPLPRLPHKTYVNPESLNYPMLLAHFLDR